MNILPAIQDELRTHFPTLPTSIVQLNGNIFEGLTNLTDCPAIKMYLDEYYYIYIVQRDAVLNVALRGIYGNHQIELCDPKFLDKLFVIISTFAKDAAVAVFEQAFDGYS